MGIQKVTDQNWGDGEVLVELETYLRETLLPAFSFVVSHLNDFPDLLDERLPFVLQDELTLHLKQGSTLLSVSRRLKYKE